MARVPCPRCLKNTQLTGTRVHNQSPTRGNAGLHQTPNKYDEPFLPCRSGDRAAARTAQNTPSVPRSGFIGAAVHGVIALLLRLRFLPVCKKILVRVHASSKDRPPITPHSDYASASSRPLQPRTDLCSISTPPVSTAHSRT
jgi:hypothetical protein